MPYVGKQPLAGAFKKLDSITSAATATFALQYNGAPYTPASATTLLVSVNGVTQAPIDSYGVNGSNIVFTSALSASDVIDYIVALGDVGNATVPVDGSVTQAKLDPTLVLGGGSYLGDSGGGTADIFRVHESELNTSVTVLANTNALCAGPLTLATGVTVTVNGNLVIA